MSVQTLFDYRRNGPPVILPRLLPAEWQPASSVDTLVIENVNVREINSKIYKTKATTVTGSDTFPAGGASTVVTLADGFEFGNFDWSIAIMPNEQMVSDGPWAIVTANNSFACGSGAAAGDTNTYAFAYTATGIVTEAAAAESAPLDYGPVTKRGPLWSQ